MSKKIYIVGVLVIFAGLIALILKFGIKPRPLNVMKPSYFSNPEEMGAVIFRRFYEEFGKERLFIFGVPAQASFQQNILAGLLRVSTREGRGFDVLIADPRLPQMESLPNMTVVPLSVNGEDLKDVINLVKSYLAQQKRVLIYTYSTMSSHLLAANAVGLLEKEIAQPIFSITTGAMSLAHDQEYALDPPCVGANRDDTGTADLGCTIMQTSRMYYHRHFDPTRYLAVMDQHGRSDFLLLTAGPKDAHLESTKSAENAQRPSNEEPTTPTPAPIAEKLGKHKGKSKYYDGGNLETRGASGGTTQIDPNENVEEDVQ